MAFGRISAGRSKAIGARVFLGALTLQLANPKALLFFLALLPQFIDPARAVVPQMLILAATSMLPEFCILTGIRLACASRAACVREIRHVGQHEPLAGVDRGRGSAGLRDPGTEIQSGRLAGSGIGESYRSLVSAIACACVIVWASAGWPREAATSAWCIDSCRLRFRPTASLVASVEGDSPPSGYTAGSGSRDPARARRRCRQDRDALRPGAAMLAGLADLESGRQTPELSRCVRRAATRARCTRWPPTAAA